MATQAQILANQANAQKSCGPSSTAGKQASSQNRRVHGLSDPGTAFILRSSEDESQFLALQESLHNEYLPQNETENILVRRMLHSEWLRLRAIMLQNLCHDLDTGYLENEKHFALYMRYQTTHERAFYRAMNELQKIRKEKRNEEIGFVSQQRAAEVHEMRKQTFEMKKTTFETRKTSSPIAKETPAPVSAADSSPQNLEMAA